MPPLSTSPRRALRDPTAPWFWRLALEQLPTKPERGRRERAIPVRLVGTLEVGFSCLARRSDPVWTVELVLGLHVESYFQNVTVFNHIIFALLANLA